MPITVRAAVENDANLLEALNRTVQDLHVAALPAYFKNPEPGAVAELFRSKLGRPNVRGWIASVDAVPAGYALAVLRERPETPLTHARRFYELDEIAVSPAHRRQGVARVLVDCVLAEAQSQGVRDVELTTWAFNTNAHAAFAALGFQPMLVRFRRASD